MHKNNNANKACIDPNEKDKIQWSDIFSRVVFLSNFDFQTFFQQYFFT